MTFSELHIKIKLLHRREEYVTIIKSVGLAIKKIIILYCKNLT